MKRINFVILASLAVTTIVVFQNCSSGGGGGSGSSGAPASAVSTSVQGTDLTGAWKLTGVECLSPDLKTLTSAEAFDSSYTGAIVVSGNNVSTASEYGSCLVKTIGTWILDPVKGLSQTESVTFATNGSCSQSLSLVGGAISPASVSMTFTINEVLPAVNNATATLTNPTLMDLYAPAFTDGQGGPCFFAYQKQ